MRAAVKQCLWERVGDDLVVIFDPREAVTLADPDGNVEALLAELRRGPRTPGEISTALVAQGRDVTEADVEAALTALDSLGLVEDGAGLELGDLEADARHTSNLAFFSIHAGLQRPRSEFMQRLRDSHVLVLGVGGAGSAALMCLAGLGVGRLTLLDRDEVEPRNFARQFVYRHSDLGRSKVDRAAEWVREYDPTIEVRTVERWINAPNDVTDLLDGVDMIVGGVDGPPEVHLSVNDAAVLAGIPLTAGGFVRSQFVIYSVNPGHGPCRRCDQSERGDSPAAEVLRRRAVELLQTNDLIGPLAMQIGSLVAYEAVRYLTGFEPPRIAGGYLVIDLRSEWQTRWEPFVEDPDCPVCPLSPIRRPADASPVSQVEPA